MSSIVDVGTAVVYVVWCLWYFNIASTADVHVAEERRGERIEFRLSLLKGGDIVAMTI